MSCLFILVQCLIIYCWYGNEIRQELFVMIYKNSLILAMLLILLRFNQVIQNYFY